MARRALDCELKRKVAFLACAHQGHLSFYPNDHALEDAAPFVDDPGQLHATLFEQLANTFGSVYATGFLVVAKGKLDRALWPRAARQERFGGFHDANELVLDIQGAAPPNEPIRNHAVERGVRPTVQRF